VSVCIIGKSVGGKKQGKKKCGKYFHKSVSRLIFFIIPWLIAKSNHNDKFFCKIVIIFPAGF
jgi:hypothetical protein